MMSYPIFSNSYPCVGFNTQLHPNTFQNMFSFEFPNLKIGGLVPTTQSQEGGGGLAWPNNHTPNLRVVSLTSRTKATESATQGKKMEAPSSPGWKMASSNMRVPAVVMGMYVCILWPSESEKSARPLN